MSSLPRCRGTSDKNPAPRGNCSSSLRCHVSARKGNTVDQTPPVRRFIAILWMDKSLHRFEMMGHQSLLVFTGELSFRGFLDGAGFRPSTECTGIHPSQVVLNGLCPVGTNRGSDWLRDLGVEWHPQVRAFPMRNRGRCFIFRGAGKAPFLA